MMKQYMSLYIFGIKAKLHRRNNTSLNKPKMFRRRALPITPLNSPILQRRYLYSPSIRSMSTISFYSDNTYENRHIESYQYTTDFIN